METARIVALVVAVLLLGAPGATVFVAWGWWPGWRYPAGGTTRSYEEVRRSHSIRPRTILALLLGPPALGLAILGAVAATEALSF